MQLWIRLLLQGLLPFCRDVLLSPRYTCGVVGVTGSEGTIHLYAFEWIKIAGGVGSRLCGHRTFHMLTVPCKCKESVGIPRLMPAWLARGYVGLQAHATPS
jgi:hypothetical protein